MDDDLRQDSLNDLFYQDEKLNSLLDEDEDMLLADDPFLQ